MVTKFGRKSHCKEVNALLGSKVMPVVSRVNRPVVKLFRNARWLPILYEESLPECNALLGSMVMQGSVGVTRGQIAKKWLPCLVGRTPDQSVM